jgi:hypothetical protein
MIFGKCVTDEVCQNLPGLVNIRKIPLSEDPPVTASVPGGKV